MYISLGMFQVAYHYHQTTPHYSSALACSGPMTLVILDSSLVIPLHTSAHQIQFTSPASTQTLISSQILR